MTTQPEQAVGGDATPESPVDAFEALAEEMLAGDAPDEPEEEAEGEAEAAPEETDEPTDDDLDDEVDELPPIEPPVSLTAEEKEAFKDWPRDAQETMVRRVGELEKGFQTKAQEAAQKERAAMEKAAEFIQQTHAEQAEVLEFYSNLLVYPKPSARLVAENPGLYAQQLEAHEQSLAQRHEAQQRVQEHRAQQQHYQQMLEQSRIEADHRLLSAELPEIYDPTEGPKLRDQLAATARALGFSDEEITAADAKSILTLKKFTDLKAKADKYDALQRRKMERVRAGKNPPPVTKPGAPRGASQVKAQRAEEAFARAKASSGQAKHDAFGEYLSNAGII